MNESEGGMTSESSTEGNSGKSRGADDPGTVASSGQLQEYLLTYRMGLKPKKKFSLATRE